MIDDYAALITETDTPPEFYHKGDDPKKRNKNRLANSRAEKRANSTVIAWDGEGIDLRGPGRPQSYVLFGCSAEPDNPLIISSPDQSLGYRQMIDYICDVGSRNPGAVHIGYGFGYDQNMIIAAMPLEWKRRLYNGGAIVYYDSQAKQVKYRVKITWKKRFEVTRTTATNKVTVRIDDVSSFFHASFVSAYERVVKEIDDNWNVVVEGKAARGQNTFENLDNIRTYWRAEILALAKLGRAFKSLMVGGGFALTDWYGPGALANFLRRTEKLKEHEWGAKEANIPAGVHIAAKSAFYGGRFEQFLCGRITGPVFSIDINSAYPSAFCAIPSLKEGGFWQHVEKPSSFPVFGVYRIRYADESRITSHGVPRRSDCMQPLPYRDKDGNISYPSLTEGWYWRPEAQAVWELYPDNVTVYEGWEWRPSDNEYPWRDVMQRMFAIRKELKRNGDITEMAYKLAINSLYGKMAQRVGWNKETKTPPLSHSLAIAGFITSHCRAVLLRVMAQIPVGELIAVETDGIYTTANPARLDLPTGIGDELGQWELEVFDEMLYIQNGVYCARQCADWVKTKSRGFSSILVPPDVMSKYLQSLMPRERWQPLKISKKVSSFIGIGLALQLARNKKNSINPAKAAILHCQWVEQEREMIPGGKGKRIHVPAYCPACDDGTNSYESPHLLVSNHGTVPTAFRYILTKGQSAEPYWNPKSGSYRLPWETTEVETWRNNAIEDEERIERDVALLGAMPGVQVL